MRYCFYAMLLLMGANTHAQPQTITASIESLSWMAGSWKGLLGEQTVEETWSPPEMGSMDISTQSVSFVADANSGIKQLSYTRIAQDQLKVEVTVATGDVFSVNLRPK
jgi:hypothetical protein